MQNVQVVTGAFGYSGSCIARRLLEAGVTVRTLTNSPGRAGELAGRVEAKPLSFEDPSQLAASLSGAGVLYTTYWVRFNLAGFSHSRAVENTLRLFEAAKTAGVRRVVHVSITNPSEDSPYEYFRGKARLEKALVASGLSYAILRPAVFFGGPDILINNICWMLRRFPVFPVFGSGEYRLQPIHVEDFADLAVAQGSNREHAIVDAIGPETFTYRELARTLGCILGKQRPILPVPPGLGLLAGRVLGTLLRDVVITREEIGGLMAGLLCTDSPPAGKTRLTDWARANARSLGKSYASELSRRRNRSTGYARP